ncbi:hypothetical protein LSAT2_022764, partial [Lamellibrachia satsuma]
NMTQHLGMGQNHPTRWNGKEASPKKWECENIIYYREKPTAGSTNTHHADLLQIHTMLIYYKYTPC